MPEKKSGKTVKISNRMITFFMIIAVLLIAVVIMILRSVNAGSGVTANFAKCIGQHSSVFVETGCSHCAAQESLFGDNWQYVNYTDCANSSLTQKCVNANITAVPTWIINGNRYLGVQSIAQLKNLTGC